MAKDPQLEQPPIDTESAEMGKPSEPAVQPPAPPAPAEEVDPYAGNGEVDIPYWLSCMEDAERAEKDWRTRGREIVEIYRNEGRMGRTGKLGAGPVTFNVLYANTEVMLPAIYSKPPQPVVRSRFVKTQEPQPPPMMPGMGPPGMPPMPPPGLGAPPGAPMPPGLPPELAAAGGPGGVPLPPGMPPPAPPPPGMPMGGPPMPPMPPGPPVAPPSPVGGPGVPPEMMASPLAMDAAQGAPPPNNIDIGINFTGLQPEPPPPPPPEPPPPPFGALPGAPPPPMPGLPMPAPGRPPQKDIEAAASIMEKALQIVMDDEQSNESIKLALKDVLLPGRGCCRVRWQPEMETQPVEDPVMGGPLSLPGAPPPLPGAAPPLTQDVKVWERVSSEFVYWEDLLVDPVRSAADQNWLAFRHLFDEEQLEAEFAGSPKYELLKENNRLSDILRWTDESAAKSPVGGGSSMKTAEKLGGHRRKAMVWEIWDRSKREIIWFIRESNGLVLRVDPDSYQLAGFFPIPVPVLSIRTTDSRIPRPFFDLYARLAQDLDETSARISDLTKQIKVRGGYNSASREIAGILRADDGKMLPVDGIDMINGGLQNHIWLVPIEVFIIALEKLYLAREQTKAAIYEIMGISDIMRGATKASETATAQRIKGSMGMVRLEDLKQTAGNFVRDLMRLKAELIAQNFDAQTLEMMTGEAVTPGVEAVLRDDFMRTCSIDIEADSTVEVDMQAEQEAMAMTMQAVSSVMQGAQQMLMTQIMPPPQVMNLSLEMLKMFLHPIKYSRGVVELIEDAQEQLQAQMAMLAMMPPMPPPGPPVGPPPPGVASGPKPSAGGPVGRSNGSTGSPPGGNGAAPPSIPGGQGLPPMPPGA